MNKVKVLISKYKKTSKITIIAIFALTIIAIIADITGHRTWYGNLIIYSHCAFWGTLIAIDTFKQIREW